MPFRIGKKMADSTGDEEIFLKIATGVEDSGEKTITAEREKENELYVT